MAFYILPYRYFHSARFASFQRQLSLYRFSRISNKSEDDHGYFYHEYFLRGRLDLTQKIKRSYYKKGTRQRGGRNYSRMQPLRLDTLPVCREMTIEEIQSLPSATVEDIVEESEPKILRQDGERTPQPNPGAEKGTAPLRVFRFDDRTVSSEGVFDRMTGKYTIPR